MTNPKNHIRNTLVTAVLFLFVAALTTSAMEKTLWQSGVIMGYTMGQNGSAWPNPIKDPLSNNNRDGYYISQLRVKATVPFDSTFSAVFVGNVINLDPQETYLQKKWGQYQFRAGKFRGAGIKSGPGTDEFERTVISPPRYTRLEDYYLKTFSYRDFGVEVQRDNLSGNVTQRFFLRNGNRQNIINDEPSWYEGQPAAQASALDYALDWKVSPYTTTGGHIGAAVDHAWDEFVGTHDGWEAGYWFKTNAFVEGSLYHQMDFKKLHLLNEGLLILDRQIRTLPDSTPLQIWGVSSTLRLDHTEKWKSFYRYEYLDPSDGLYGEDNLQMITLGGIFYPSPVQYGNLSITAQYTRTIEEGMRNLVSNDNFFVQLKMLF